MKVFLDDERSTPPGWVQARWPEDVIALLETGRVTEVSLDHDLGDDRHGTGYDVLIWIEEAVATRAFKAPALRVHSANSSARQRMEAAIRAIERFAGTASSTPEANMRRVTGIGGIFIRAQDPAKLGAWYKTHLGIDVQVWGGAAFRWVDEAGAPANGTTAWSVGDGSQFEPSKASFMVNYRVADLRGLLQALREEGCQVLDKVDESEFGIFGWVMDPEGNKVELWQPPEGQ